PRPSQPRSRAAMPKDDPEPRWPAFVAVLAAGGLYLALPSGLTVLPRWGFLVFVGTLLAATVFLHRIGHHRLDRVLGFTLTSFLTLQMILSLVLLVGALPSHRESPGMLLVSAGSLWATNVLVFALWYWRLDAGGPHRRDQRGSPTAGGVLVPPMGPSPGAKDPDPAELWSPEA